LIDSFLDSGCVAGYPHGPHQYICTPTYQVPSVKYPASNTENQLRFGEFLFHLLEVAVVVDFAREKKMFFTGFAHHKSGLWKSCELCLASRL
jgi:hypothetical protein